MRRTALIAILITLLVGLFPGTALAWCNGPGKGGHPGNGYGSHDWILDGAIKQAGAKGVWVWDRTALLASDNPDSQHTSPVYHWLQETGRVRGAPWMISELYRKAVVSYRNGDRKAASTYLGVLSHYYADINEPFHTAGLASSYKSLHIQYEYAVDDYTNAPTKSRSWITQRPVQPVTDIRAKAISAALYARSKFPSLLSSYKSSRRVRTGTPNKITRLVLSRAVNDLADIISTIPTGLGRASAPATVEFDMAYARVPQNHKAGARVTVTDANGKPLDGVRVKFVWHLPAGNETRTTYTDANGYVIHWLDIGKTPVGRRVSVAAYVSMNGTTESPKTSFTATR